MHCRLLVFLLCLSAASAAQRSVPVGREHSPATPGAILVVNGEPFVNQKYVDLVSGSPYFSEAYFPGKLIGKNGLEYNNVQIKLDLLGGEVVYRDSLGREMTALTPLKAVVLNPDKTKGMYFMRTASLPLLKSIKDPWIQVLFDGITPLFKTYTKEVSEKKDYGSATTEQTIRTREQYWVMKDNRLLELGKLKNVPGVLHDKKKELEAYLKDKDDEQQPLDERFVRLLDFYNHLLEKEKQK